MPANAPGTDAVDTGLRISGRNIVGNTDIPHYHIRGGKIIGRRGDTGYYVDGNSISGPEGETGFRIDAGRIVGPSKSVPWAPHADGSDEVGPGY